MAEDLSKALTQAVVRRLASEEAYSRGLQWNTSGEVEILSAKKGSTEARVEQHHVELSSDEGVLQYSCSCPEGEQSEFCEHCAAAAFAWLDAQKATTEKTAPKKKAKNGKKRLNLADAIALLLDEEEKPAILQALQTWAEADAELAQKVILFASRRADPGARAAVIFKTLREAIRVRAITKFKLGPWTRQIALALDRVEELLKEGQAEDVAGMCEEALRELEATAERLWEVGEQYEPLRERLEALHLRACLEARPDPVDLARRIYALERDSRLGFLRDAAQRYAPLLGTRGLAEMRAHLEADWNRLHPVRTYGEWRSWDKGGRQVQRMMESLAAQEGDPARLIEAMRKDLSTGERYHRIATLLLEQGRTEEALDVAEEGLRVHPAEERDALRAMVTEAYHKLGRKDAALRLAWQTFESNPTLQAWKLLRAQAQAAGDWPKTRKQALDHMRRRIEALEANKKDWHLRAHIPILRDLMVEALLDDGDAKAARAEAEKNGASARMWIHLAQALEEEDPQFALDAFFDEAISLAEEGGGNRNAELAIALLERAAMAAERCGATTTLAGALQSLEARTAWNREFIRRLKPFRAEHPGL